MKKTLVALAAIMVTALSFGQGAVVFNTAITGSVRAPVQRGNTLPNPTTGAGAGFSAQLFLVEGTTLTPLTPVTTFRTTSAAASFFVTPTDVIIDGKAPGTQASLRMRAFETAAGSYAAASTSTTFGWGESNDITVTLGGGNLAPANLVGLNGFEVNIVPEPSTIALGVLGAAALLFRRRK